ncbi:Ger(x)C family spore germination protein [Numidum massiliense]|uniref:Ger(x)C family spore germination protein n=1 Tax=Numidum massiliense TaxID=1522315 RepID=UPI0006D55FE9|nr:Ger(x)C family spore germination protein [Numidum massiliense]
MRKWVKTTLLFLPTLLLLSACWDATNIQDVNYLAALGVDYDNGKYTVYVQLLDHSSVAKEEADKPTQPVPVWVGKASGDTPSTAVNNLYNTAQQKISFSHISSLLVSVRALQHDLEPILDSLGRFREIRYTPWLFATKEKIEDVFAKLPFFYLSPLISVMHQPQETYGQLSITPPLRYHRFISEYREPGSTVLLPLLSLNRSQWRESMERKALIGVGGVAALHDRKYKGTFSEKQLRGTRWITGKTVRSPLTFRADGKGQATVSLGDPSVTVKSHIKDGIPRFHVTITLDGNLVESFDSTPVHLIRRHAEQEVARQVRQTYLHGLKRETDLLQLEEYLYRYHNKQWKQLDAKKFPLTPESLASVHVKVNLIHTGKYKEKN